MAVGARQKLIEAGGTPRLTRDERDYLNYYRKCAQEYGWTEKPAWVERLEAWEAQETE